MKTKKCNVLLHAYAPCEVCIENDWQDPLHPIDEIRIAGEETTLCYECWIEFGDGTKWDDAPRILLALENFKQPGLDNGGEQ